MIRKAVFSGVLMAALSAAGLRSVSAGKVPAAVNVTAVLADSGGTGVPLLVGSDQMGGYPGADTNVKSVITSNTQGSFWSLTTYYTSRGKLTGSTRRLWLQLIEAAAQGQPTPPITSAYVQASFMANCDTVLFDLLGMTQNAAGNCPGLLRFQAPNSKWYKLAFQPQNYPETDRMRVVCNLTGPAGCAQWTVSPIGDRFNGTDPNPKSLVRLTEINEGGTVLNPNLGDYYISFSMTVTR